MKLLTIDSGFYYDILKLDMAEDVRQILDETKRHFDEKTEETKRHFDVVAEDLKGKMDTISEQVAANTENIVTIKNDVHKIRDDIEIIKIDIEFIKNDLKQKVSRDEFVVLEKRVSMLEAKSGK